MLKHSSPRIQGYTVDLRQLLKLYSQAAKESGFQGAEPSLALRLNALSDTVFNNRSSTEAKTDALVLEAHAIYRTFCPDEFDNLGFSRAQNLSSTLGFIGRLRSSFSVLVLAAERLEGFENLDVSTVDSISNEPRERVSYKDGSLELGPALRASRMHPEQ